jgi:hypothetical protein
MLTTPARRKRHATGAALSILAFTTALTLSGCSIPGLPGPTGAPATGQPADLVSVSATTPTAAATQPAATVATPVTAPAPPPRKAPVPVWKPVRGDLASGSKTHRLGAAAHTLIIDYWTTEDPSAWSPDSSPIINLNARIGGASTGEAVKVTRFNARVDALGAVLANDTGSFAIDPPYAYSSGVVVPANPKATSTKIVFTIDLLTETAPGTGIFTRQTILDSLTIGYPKPGAVFAAAVSKAAGTVKP